MTKLPIKGLYIIEPTMCEDGGEYFVETYNKKEMREVGLNLNFVQDNESLSLKGVLRGLHLQMNYPQGKLVRVMQGKVFDVAVDLRKGSETFGKWFGVELSEDSNKQFYIPEGFAHGFYVMSEKAKFCYKVTEYWDPTDELGIPWDDPTINIEWPIPKGEQPIVAEKDKHYLPFNQIEW